MERTGREAREVISPHPRNRKARRNFTAVHRIVSLRTLFPERTGSTRSRTGVPRVIPRMGTHRRPNRKTRTLHNGRWADPSTGGFSEGNRNLHEVLRWAALLCPPSHRRPSEARTSALDFGARGREISHSSTSRGFTSVMTCAPQRGNTWPLSQDS
jgi:hypothetical protein